MCLFKITNIEEINTKFSRETGNKTITQISNTIKNKLLSEYIFVRYMGPKFAIVFSGVEPEAVKEFCKNLKKCGRAKNFSSRRL